MLSGSLFYSFNDKKYLDFLHSKICEDWLVQLARYVLVSKFFGKYR
jgi:hypothetical protein